MTITRKIHTLKQYLGGRYQLADERHNLCGRQICVTCVEDAEALFSRQILVDEDLEKQEESLPFWACLWPSALSLAQVLAAGDYLRPGQNALELGAGLGLVSAVACMKRVKVTTTDCQPDSLEFARLNCLQIAGVDLEVMTLDWFRPPKDRQYEVILGSDLVYDARFFDALIRCFEALLEPAGQIYFSEPNREMGRVFFDRLGERGWRVEAILEGSDATVYLIRRSKNMMSDCG